MDPDAPVGDHRRGFVRRWRLWISLLLGLPAALLLLGNLALTSPWCCRWIASKIERRTGGLEARIAGASLTPWHGASIYGLTILQPPPLRGALTEPLLRIDAVRLAPVWRSWIHGRLEVQSINLDSPRLVVPLELISHLAKPALPPVPAEPAPAAPPVSPPVAPVQPGPPVPPVPELPKVPPLPAPPPQPTGWLRMKNASIAVVHAGSRRTLVAIAKANGAIPIAGDPAQSHFHIGSIASLENEAISNLTTTLEWKFPMLSLKPLEAQAGGYKFLVAAKIARFSNVPVQFEVQLPRQPLAEISLPFNGKLHAESIAANARFRGLLLSPATWQGDLIADAVSPTLRAGDNEAKFDRGSTVTVLRGGILSCADARLIGDALSLLGNGTILADGRLAGAGRLVAPPETVTSITGKLFPNITAGPSFTPLATPQRVAFDVEAFGNLSQVFLRLGKEGPVVQFKP
jgi:hypothetical protein